MMREIGSEHDSRVVGSRALRSRGLDLVGPSGEDWRVGITRQQLEQMTARLERPKRRAEPVMERSGPTGRGTGAGLGTATIVLGIDPSLRGTGWGVIRVERGAAQALGYGTIRCPSAWLRSRCLVRIAEELRTAIREHAPTVCAIEGLFFAQNLQTALLMGEARGVCLLAAAEAGLEISEIAPRRVKLAIVGFGGAQKVAVARMVQRRLNLAEEPAADAADALALALAHAQESSGFRLTPTRKL